MMKKLLYIFVFAIFLISCGKDNLSEIKEGETVTVSLNVAAALPTGLDVKSNVPYPIEKENLLTSLWVIQYGSKNQILGEPRLIEFQSPTMIYNGNIELQASSSSTVCFIANVSESELRAMLRGYSGELDADSSDLSELIGLVLPSYKLRKLEYLTTIEKIRPESPTGASSDIPAGLTSIPMSGYWQGPVSGNMSLNASLTRMLSRINLNISMAGGISLKQLVLKNISSEVYLFPRIDALGTETYLDGGLTIFPFNGETSPVQTSLSRVIYLTPNLASDISKATVIVMTYNKNGTDKIVTQLLTNKGDDSDFKLYPNAFYTVNLSVK